MSEINFNSIYDGVSLALHAAFPDAQVHGGAIKQGCKPGDFNVIMPTLNHSKEVGHRFKRTPVVDVIYYMPRTGNAAALNVAHKLTRVLQSITTPEGDVVHAAACEITMDDSTGTLHALLKYPHFGRYPQTLENMETLKVIEEG